MSTADKYRENARRVRLPRLVQLRRLGAPRWLIRDEQIGLVANRRGLSRAHKSMVPLWEKYVQPLLERD